MYLLWIERLSFSVILWPAEPELPIFLLEEQLSAILLAVLVGWLKLHDSILTTRKKKPKQTQNPKKRKKVQDFLPSAFMKRKPLSSPWGCLCERSRKAGLDASTRAAENGAHWGRTVGFWVSEHLRCALSCQLEGFVLAYEADFISQVKIDNAG